MKYVLGLLACVLATVCAYAPVAAGARSKCGYSSAKTGEMAFFHNCTWTDRDGSLRLKPQYLRALSFDRFGLAEIVIEGEPSAKDGFWYANRGGKLAPVLQMDNGPDPFNDGLARAPSGKKIGYIDRHFQFVISAIYDGAHPFDRGRAVVCIGCVERHDPESEYHYYEGGRWGCVDLRGREVVPLKPMKNGDALFAGHCHK